LHLGRKFAVTQGLGVRVVLIVIRFAFNLCSLFSAGRRTNIGIGVHFYRVITLVDIDVNGALSIATTWRRDDSQELSVILARVQPKRSAISWAGFDAKHFSITFLRFHAKRLIVARRRFDAQSLAITVVGVDFDFALGVCIVIPINIYIGLDRSIAVAIDIYVGINAIHRAVGRAARKTGRASRTRRAH
jgi:hypothetical protein